MKIKAELPDCPVATTISLIGIKWKLLILRNLLIRPWRFNELRKSLDGISQKVLTDSLRPIIKSMEVFGIDYKEQLEKITTNKMSRTAIGTVLLIFIFQFSRAFPRTSQSRHKSELRFDCSPSDLHSRQQRAAYSAFPQQFVF